MHILCVLGCEWVCAILAYRDYTRLRNGREKLSKTIGNICRIVIIDSLVVLDYIDME